MSEINHWRNAFNSEFLSSADIDLGVDLNLVISNVVQKSVVLSQGRKELKNIAYFTNKNYKPMILNATNCKILQHFTGKGDYTLWKNINILVYVDNKVSFKGETVDGLRFRTYQPLPKKKYECEDCGRKDVEESIAVRAKKAFNAFLCKDCGIKRAEKSKNTNSDLEKE